MSVSIMLSRHLERSGAVDWIEATKCLGTACSAGAYNLHVMLYLMDISSYQ